MSRPDGLRAHPGAPAASGRVPVSPTTVPAGLLVPRVCRPGCPGGVSVQRTVIPEPQGASERRRRRRPRTSPPTGRRKRGRRWRYSRWRKKGPRSRRSEYSCTGIGQHSQRFLISGLPAVSWSRGPCSRFLAIDMREFETVQSGSPPGTDFITRIGELESAGRQRDFVPVQL